MDASRIANLLEPFLAQALTPGQLNNISTYIDILLRWNARINLTAVRNGGEYYTPRPLIRAIVQVVKPKIGDRIYDGAVGSAGFLCELFEYLTKGKNLTTKEARLVPRFS